MSRPGVQPRPIRAALPLWRQGVRDKLAAIARQTVMEAAVQVVKATPVDTGFLRGSWQPSIGEPQVHASPAPDPGGGMAAAQISLVIASLKVGETFWMTNNAAYGRHVEFGTSKMEPRRFVRGTLARWPRFVAKVMADLKVGGS